MATTNTFTMIGSVFQTPQMRTLPSGSNVCDLLLQVEQTKFTRGGGTELVKNVHQFEAFGKMAEALQAYVEGDMLAVSGEIETRCSDRDGKKSYWSKLVVRDVNGLGITIQREDDIPGDGGF